jgi:hypothetical protein
MSTVVGREWGLRMVPGGPAVLGAVRGCGRFGVPVGRCYDRMVMKYNSSTHSCTSNLMMA